MELLMTRSANHNEIRDGVVPAVQITMVDDEVRCPMTPSTLSFWTDESAVDGRSTAPVRASLHSRYQVSVAFRIAPPGTEFRRGVPMSGDREPYSTFLTELVYGTAPPIAVVRPVAYHTGSVS